MQFPIVSQFYNLPKNFLETFIGYVFMFKFTFARYATREVELKIAWRPKLARKGFKSFLVTLIESIHKIERCIFISNFI